MLAERTSACAIKPITLLQTLESPRFWIVAGPNGSGKSSLYDRTDIEGFGRSVWIINPDLLSARIADREDMPLLNANGQALDRIWKWLEASIHAHQTVGVETVLSTDKYRVLVERPKALGFEFRLLYVFLRTADMNVDRVRLRVLKGGHDVPEDKVRSRWDKSFKKLPWFLDQADMALVYDNSGAQPRLVAQKIQGIITVDPTAAEPIRKAAAILDDTKPPKS